MAKESNIWIAVSDDDMERVKQLVAADKSQVNAQDANGYSPLHAAASWKRVELLKYLLENGGNVNIADTDGDTPLHICEDKACAELLLEHGADPECKNNEGLTPVHTTLENEAMEVTELLCERLKIPVPELSQAEEGDEEEEQHQVNVSEEKLQDISNWIMQQADDADDADEDALREMVTKYIMNNLRISSGEADDTAAATIATSTDNKLQDNESTATDSKK